MKLKEKIAKLWDFVPELTSLNRRIEIARATMLLLQTVFASAMSKSSNVYYNFPSFRLSFAEGNPTTYNKYNSGIYIMMQMKCYSIIHHCGRIARSISLIWTFCHIYTLHSYGN
ncbi:PREDICTED: uncharacterized protein LOC101309746 [Fragaria vesca subsp. vesca]